jgi:SAM-dependent methyltransferase
MYVEASQEYAVIDDRAQARLDRFLARFVERLAVRFEGDVLDIGCMDGRMTSAYPRTARSITGLDIVPHGAWKSLQRDGLDFVAGDAQQLPFDNASFDLVVANAMLHHVPSPTRVIREMLRVRRPGGRIVIIEPNRLNPMTWVHLTLLDDHDHFRTKDFIALVDRIVPILEFRQFEAHLWPTDADGLRDRLERLDDELSASAWWRPFILWNVAVL